MYCSVFYSYPLYRCDAHDDQADQDSQVVLEDMNKEELEILEESAGLKWQDMAEVFETPEGKTQCSQHLVRFGPLGIILTFFLAVLNHVSLARYFLRWRMPSLLLRAAPPPRRSAPRSSRCPVLTLMMTRSWWPDLTLLRYRSFCLILLLLL